MDLKKATIGVDNDELYGSSGVYGELASWCRWRGIVLRKPYNE